MSSRKESMLTPRVCRVIENLDPLHKKDAYALLKALKQADVSSYSDLINKLPSLPAKLRIFGTWLLGTARLRQAAPALFKILRTDRVARGEAAAALGLISGTRLVRRLLRSLNEETDNQIRLLVVTALRISMHKEATQAFLSIAACRNEAPRVRAQAIEGLAYALEGVDRRSTSFKRASKVLREVLKSEIREIRENAAFAVRELSVRI